MKKGSIILIVCVVALLFIGGLTGWYLFENSKIATVITMDINPSITISLNKKDRVVKVNSLNDDGKSLIKDKSFKGKKLETAVKDISTLLVDEGFINEEKNVVLINVEGKDIQNTVDTLIKDSLKEKNIEGNVILQEVSDTAKEKANNYGISPSKSSYIESIVEDNEGLTFEELKDKTIQEINEIVVNKVEAEKKAEEERLAEEKRLVEEEKLA